MTWHARAFATGNYGYSQGSGVKDGRWSGLSYNPGNFDCSSSCGAIAFRGGMINKSVLSGTFYTGNFRSKMVDTGMFFSVPVSRMSLTQLKNEAKEGDFLLGPGHVVYCLGKGECVSFEANELGKQFGGKVGDQTGKEGRIRTLYRRSKGWTYLIRPVSPNTLLARALVAMATKKPVGMELANLIARRSPWDGPRLLDLLKQVETTFEGLPMLFNPDALPDGLGVEHTFVVLGAGLNADGTLTSKFTRRLELALQAHKKAPTATILISGGKPRGGVTEAQAGAQWLLDKGVPHSVVRKEEQASSTVGNASFCTPLLASAKTATLISDASHLRRAQILFTAAQTKADTVVNKRGGPKWLPPLAFNDYGQRTVKPLKPVDAASRLAIVSEVARALGVSKQFSELMV